MDALEEKKGNRKGVRTKANDASEAVLRPGSIVTARVPAEIREQGNEVLKRIGSTPTELINTAYLYVLEHEALPLAEPSLEDLRDRRRVLTPEQKDALRQRMQSMRLKAPEGWGARTFKDLLSEARDERNARFA